MNKIWTGWSSTTPTTEATDVRMVFRMDRSRVTFLKLGWTKTGVTLGTLVTLFTCDVLTFCHFCRNVFQCDLIFDVKMRNWEQIQNLINGSSGWNITNETPIEEWSKEDFEILMRNSFWNENCDVIFRRKTFKGVGQHRTECCQYQSIRSENWNWVLMIQIWIANERDVSEESCDILKLRQKCLGQAWIQGFEFLIGHS